MTKPINPKIVALLKDGDKEMKGYSVNGENCVEILQMMAIQHLTNKVEENDSLKKDQRRKNSPQLLSV